MFEIDSTMLVFWTFIVGVLALIGVGVRSALRSLSSPTDDKSGEKPLAALPRGRRDARGRLLVDRGGRTMAGMSRKIALVLAGMGRKKKIALGLFGIWLVGVGIAHLVTPFADSKAHAQAQAQAPALPHPTPPWALITKEQALALAQADDALGQDWMASATSYSKVVCNGRAYWRITFKYDNPKPWYESRRQGFNVGFANCNTVRPLDIYRHGESGKAKTSKRAATTVSPAVKKKVRAILLGSLNHYEQLLHTGERALGNTQYATSMQGVDAFSDPDSAASRFSAWRQKSNAESDLSFLAAFSKADSFYNAKNEPDAIGTWRDDMSLATGYFNVWTELAVGWQIKEHTTAQLQASTRRLERMLAKARRDVAAVVAAR